LVRASRSEIPLYMNCAATQVLQAHSAPLRTAGHPGATQLACGIGTRLSSLEFSSVIADKCFKQRKERTALKHKLYLMLTSELGNPFLRYCQHMKYATSQKALQRLEQEYLARLSPSQAIVVRPALLRCTILGKSYYGYTKGVLSRRSRGRLISSRQTGIRPGS
jgi:hypothetical protein